MKLLKFELIKRRCAVFCAAAALLPALTLTSCENDLLYVKSGGMPEVKGKFDNIVEYSYFENGDGNEDILQDSMQIASHGIFFDGDDIYFAASSNRGDILYRLDLATGNRTVICPDPLCAHNDAECPFYGLVDHSCMFADGSIIYERDYRDIDDSGEVIDSAHLLARYDFESGKYEELREVNSDSKALSAVADGENIYYIDETFDEEKYEYVRTFCSQNIETKKITRYEKYYIPIAVIDGKVLVYIDSSSDAYFWDPETDELSYVCSIAYPFVCGDELFGRTEDGRIIRYGLDGSGPVDLGVSGATYFYVTKEYVYYIAETGSVTIRMPGRGTYTSDIEHPREVLYRTETIYRMKHDGSDIKEVWHTDTENGSYLLSPWDFVVKGRYIYAAFNWDDYDKEHDVWIADVEHSGVYVRIDTETGEEYFLDFRK